MFVEKCTHETLEDWLRLRWALWPHLTVSQHRLEALAILGGPSPAVAFVARNDRFGAVGFAEVALRQDHVNGCATSPVGFLEGIYVHPEWRRLGIARLLCSAVEAWAVDLGCSELGSDVDLDNRASQRMHETLGFTETERVVFYRKLLPLERRGIPNPTGAEAQDQTSPEGGVVVAKPLKARPT
jgi:aminoglycoside 6'-N-acetyltransferase I